MKVVGETEKEKGQMDRCLNNYLYPGKSNQKKRSPLKTKSSEM